MFVSNLILIISVASFINCQCPYEQDIDYFGNDLSTNYVYYSTQDLCCAACQTNALCQAWTYIPSTTACWLKSQIGNLRIISYGRNSGVKQQITVTSTIAPTTTTTITTTTVSAPTTTTATTTTTVATVVPTTTTTTTAFSTLRQFVCNVELNVNYAGNDLPGKSNVLSPGDCCNICGSTTGCVSWAYYSAYSYCYLKSVANAAANRQAYAGIIAGQVVG